MLGDSRGLVPCRANRGQRKTCENWFSLSIVVGKRKWNPGGQVGLGGKHLYLLRNFSVVFCLFVVVCLGFSLFYFLFGVLFCFVWVSLR